MSKYTCPYCLTKRNSARGIRIHLEQMLLLHRLNTPAKRKRFAERLIAALF